MLDYRDVEPGDILIVRDWDDMAEEFGVSRDNFGEHIKVMFLFTDEMKRFCGKEFEVAKARDDGRVELANPGNSYHWSIGMFRMKNERQIHPVEDLDWKSILACK